MSFRVTAEVFSIPCGHYTFVTPDVRQAMREWRFRIKARNGEVVAQSEGYHNKQDAIDTARLLAPFVKVVEGN